MSVADVALAPIYRSYEATVDNVDKARRSVTAKINTGDIDRYRTVISPLGMDLDAYKSNPVVLHEHGQDPRRGTNPIGRNEWIKVDRGGRGSLIAKTTFRSDDYSSAIFDAYAEGYMSGWSVRVLPRDFGPPSHDEIRAWPELARDCQLVYRSSELLEYSATSIPGNAACLSMAVQRGIFVPPSLRAMTESGGLATGGGLVKPEEEDEEPKGRSRVAMNGSGIDEPCDLTGDDEEDLEGEEFDESDPPLITPAEFSGDDPESHKPHDGGMTPEVEPRGIEPQDKTNPQIEPAKTEPDDGSTTPQAPAAQRYIKEEGGKYYVHSEGGKRLSKGYASKGEAESRLREIEYFKHKGERSVEPPAQEPVVSAPGAVAAASSGKLAVRRHDGGWMVVNDRAAVLGVFPERGRAVDLVRSIQNRQPPDLSPAGYYVDSDESSWFVRQADGMEIAAFPDAWLAQAFIASQQRGSFDFATYHVTVISETALMLREMEERMIRRAEFLLLGKV
jgi:hypothetical protein